MDPSLLAPLPSLDHLSDQFRELREGVQRVVRIADEGPEIAHEVRVFPLLTLDRQWSLHIGPVREPASASRSSQ
jgi:hypothetical protein